MKNISLAEDYIVRAGHRLEAIEILLKRESYADVVRESQEAVELSLKAILRFSKIEVPRLHDVSEILKKESDIIPSTLKSHLKRISKISKQLRRDRELSFYGAEDLTPSEFYQKEDAQEAYENARWVHSVCREAMGKYL